MRLAQRLENHLLTWNSLNSHLITVAQKHRIFSFPLSVRILTERQTCPCCIHLNPPTDGSRQLHGAPSPLLCFFVMLLTSVWRCTKVQLYTQTNPLLFSLSCAPDSTVSLLSLSFGAEKISKYFCILDVQETSRCRAEMKDVVYTLDLLKILLLLFLAWYESLCHFHCTL